MSAQAYYNEIDPFAAQWLRNLIAAGHIVPGHVDERSITDVRPSDLQGFTQCHFFAGIGVWSLALRRAGWDDRGPVWTGSCPCQPFSAAGAGAGFDDERHLWARFERLIRECRPPVVIGEQVASKDADPWLDLVQDDMEGMGYAFGAVAFPAASVGAPHIRDRTYWVAHTNVPDAKRFGQVGVSLEPKQEAKRCDFGNHWSFDATVRCADGRARPIESGVQPLVNGNTCRVGRLRAYGNAIVAPQAQVWIQTVIECLP